MSSLFCFMDFMQNYHGSKGVRAHKVEDGALGILAPPLQPGGKCFAPNEKSWSRKDAPPRGVLSAQCNSGHAAGYEHKFIPIQSCIQNLIEFYHRYLEHEPVKHRHAIDFYGTAGGARHPAPVLLFELKLYSSCSASYLQLAVNRQPCYRQGTS